MRGIERLPLPLRSSIRSGVVVFDLTRIVEELIFNSLDAAATKVSVFVDVGTCFVKVVDNGSGISRDGLVLLGERYVTSKLPGDGTFGFRGETLASISDVSQIEIVTRTCGRPNGYRKVLKGSKCLYLGIDDNRKDVGTTVAVRDLFYNQPVRRNLIQSSPLKVLQSVKKCVLRVALVHSKVSFKVIDIDSEKELLSVSPSSAMSILMSDHGAEEFNSLHKLEHSDGLLSLSGCITGPGDNFSAKAFQYVYINSRFVFGGPIHKLINHLVMTFVSLDPQSDNVSQKGKRSRSQPSMAYIVNLFCPSGLYDLTFEASKTYVEFKDWGPVLTFIKKAIQQVWSRIIDGESSSHRTNLFDNSEDWRVNDDMTLGKEDLPETSVSSIDKFGSQKYPLAYSPLERLKKHPGGSYNRDFSEATGQELEMGFDFRASRSSFESPDDILEYRRNTRHKYSDDMEGNHLSSDWKNESPKVETGKMRLSLDHEDWIKQLEVSERGRDSCRDNDEAMFQELEVDTSVFKEQQVERSFDCQRRFSMKLITDIPDCERAPTVGQEYDPHFLASDHNSKFPNDKFLDERHNIRQNYNDNMEGNHLSTHWQSESLKIESAKTALSSDDEVWSKQLWVSGSGKDHYLRGCSSMGSLSRSKGMLNSEEEPEYPFGETWLKRRRLCLDENIGVLKFESNNQKGDIFIGQGEQTFSESGKDHFLHGRSSLKSLSSSKGLLTCEEEPDVPLAEPRFISRRLCSGEGIGVLEVESSNQRVDMFLGQGEQVFAESIGLPSDFEYPLAEPRFKKRRICSNENLGELKFESSNQRDDILLGQGEQGFAESIGLPSDFVLYNRSSSSGNKGFRSNSDSETSDALLRPSWNVESFPHNITDEVGVRSGTANDTRLLSLQHNYMSRDEAGWLQFDLYSEGQNSHEKYEDEGDITHEVGVRCGTVKDTSLLSLQRNHVSRDKAGWFQFDLQSEGQNSHNNYEDQGDKLGHQSGKNDPQESYYSRSRSAPPSIMQKRTSISLNSSLTAGRKPCTESVCNDDKNEMIDLEPNCIEEFVSNTRPEMNYGQSIVPDVEEVREGKQIEQECLAGHNSKGFMSNGSRELEDFGTKWRNSSRENNTKTTCDGGSHRSSILDISSGFFGLAGNVLIPESLQKNCLKKAKVLHQLDKKFIPVVAGGTLSVIDQHAADERIRLEELRDKVLSGKGRTISYLDAEEELILPEFGYQLLHDYAGRVRDWGWICNMRAQGSGMFNKNLNVMHQHTTMVTLIAVPCILGTALSGEDLLEFLQQLADTDGASTVPPCVGRVLNSKACRGAIMFGDSLLPSECALIVEELEKTQLCFQCAHGRPTTAPLVNLAALHGAIAKVGALTKKNDTFILLRQELSISRAEQRLAAARGDA